MTPVRCKRRVSKTKGNIYQRELALEYGVKQVTISEIVLMKKWAVPTP